MNGLKNLRVLDIYEAERIKEDLMEEPVVIEAPSDIILRLGPHRNNFDNLPFYDDIKDGEFINLMTGQIDDIKKDVVTDNHFLEIYLCGQLRLGDIEGIYAARSKKHDALIFCICELKRCSDGTYCWKEKKGGRTFVSASFSMNAQTIRECNHEYGYVDICGQAQAPNRNFTLGLKKKVFEYFGPLTFATKIAERAIFPMATIEQIINTINILINKDEKIYEEGIPVTKYDGAGVFAGLVKQDDSPDPGPVSADAKAAMERFMKKVVLPNFAKSFFDYGANYGKSYDVSIVLISYLQNVNGNLVERAFLPVVYPEYDFTKSEVAFYEVQQTLIQNGEYNLNSCYISSVTVYCEGDIEKTSIGGMAKWTLRPFIETINNVDALDDKGFSICHTYARFSENIEFRTIDMVQQMCEQSTDLIDKILKIKDMDFKAANLLIRQAQFAG